ncbi:MAG TPA: hypothetical protein DDW52_23255 [Planctomycetaceae bacterium]|nr:hypothetical protein [Planctomycetaceae bacterium]
MLFAFAQLNSRATPVRIESPNQWTLISIDQPPTPGWPFAYSTGNTFRDNAAIQNALSRATYHVDTPPLTYATSINWQQCANAACAIWIILFVCLTNYFLLESWISQRAASVRDYLLWTAVLAAVCALYASTSGTTYRLEPNQWDNLGILAILLFSSAAIAGWCIYFSKRHGNGRTMR